MRYRCTERHLAIIRDFVERNDPLEWLEFNRENAPDMFALQNPGFRLRQLVKQENLPVTVLIKCNPGGKICVIHKPKN